MATPDAQPITARLAAAGSRRRELEAVLTAALSSATRDDYAALVLDQNVAGKSSAVSREKLLKQLRERYLLDPGVAEFIAFRSAMAHERGWAELGLISYLMMARCDRLFREAALLLVSNGDEALGGQTSSRRSGRHGVNLDLQAFAQAFSRYLRQRKIAWSRETEDHARRHVLSSLKDFGVLTGSARKALSHRPTGPSTAAFAARLSELDGLTGRQTLSSRWFDLLCVDHDGAAELLRAAQREGLLSFRMQADVVELRLPPVSAP